MSLKQNVFVHNGEFRILTFLKKVVVDMESDTDSEEEVNELMREAANCDYVNNLYNNIESKKPEKPKEIHKEGDLRESTLSSHQVFLSKSLSKKLDSLIQIIDVDEAPKEQRNLKNIGKGIHLLKNSVLIDEPEIEEVIQKKYFPKENDVSVKERSSRAKEAAVEPGWVISKSNTAFWKFYKPKIIYATVDKRSDDKIECSIVNKTF